MHTMTRTFTAAHASRPLREEQEEDTCNPDWDLQFVRHDWLTSHGPNLQYQLLSGR